MTLIERLRGLNAEHPPFGAAHEAADEIERLTAERDALKADAERMDHLEKNVRCVSLHPDGNHSWGFLYMTGWKLGPTFREAIDNAMKETP